MKAAVVTAPGHVDVEEVPDPTPGPREVVVAVRGSGVCGTDLHILGGEFAPRLPIVPGHEFAGEVVAVGSAVDGIALGAAVAVDPSLPCHECHYCRRGRENLCERWGGDRRHRPRRGRGVRARTRAATASGSRGRRGAD